MIIYSKNIFLSFLNDGVVISVVTDLQLFQAPLDKYIKYFFIARTKNNRGKQILIN
jgi:hypothetical protein